MNLLRSRKTIHRSCFASLVGVGLVLAGCGGGAGDGSSDTGAATGSTGAGTAPTGEVTAVTTGSGTAPTSAGSEGGDTSSSGPGTSSSGASEATTGTASSSSSSGGAEAELGFFVSSVGSSTGNLGGLEGADKRCQDLADSVGAGGRTWRAYLSVEHGPDDGPVDARDRIGAGPWFNAKQVMLAADVADLHTKEGDPTLFLDEHGEMVPGQWEGSPSPNEHDILTGSNKDGTLLAGKTCGDWTSEDPGLLAQVGHSDGLGPMMSDAEQYRSWNSVHESGGCDDTAPKGGAGRVYCFAAD